MARVFIAVALAVATSAIALATFDYALVAMQADLGFSADAGNAAMLVPATASLIIVFAAGVLGDRLGRRRVMIASAMVFVAGTIVAATAQSLAQVVVGRVLEGAAGAALAITALAVLSAAFTSGRSRAMAFGAFSAIMPAVFIFAPIMGSALEQASSWRSIPLLSGAVGLLALIAVAILLPADHRQGRAEVITPLLAGVTLCCLAGAAGALMVAPVAVAVVLAIIALLAGLALVAAMRRMPTPSLDLGILRVRGGSPALLALALANAANLLFFTTLLLQYLVGLDPFDTALAMVPVQVAATAGGLVGGWIITHLGVVRAGVTTLTATAIASIGVLLVTAGSPTWVILVVASVYAFAGLTSTAPLSQRVMDLAPAEHQGTGSAFRTGSAALGAAVGGVVVAAIAFGMFQSSFAGGLEDRGFTADRAEQIATEVRHTASLTGLSPKPLGIPAREVGAVERRDAPALRDAEVTGYRAVGIAAAVSNALAALVLLGSAGAGWRRARRAAAA